MRKFIHTKLDNYLLEGSISNIPKEELTLNDFKRKVRRSYMTKKGEYLTDMDEKRFDNIIGYENVENGKIKVYRGVSTKDRTIIENGDFVTTNKKYAQEYGNVIISKIVPLEKLKYLMGNKKGNPKSVGIADKGIQPVELVYVDYEDDFSKYFKAFEYDKYLKYISL